jgi:hypothetical protein
MCFYKFKTCVTPSEGKVHWLTSLTVIYHNKQITSLHSNSKVVAVFFQQSTKLWRSIWETELYLHAFLASTLDEGEWSASRPSGFTPKERAPGNHWIGGWMGPEPVWARWWREFQPLPGLEPWSSSPKPSAIPLSSHGSPFNICNVVFPNGCKLHTGLSDIGNLSLIKKQTNACPIGFISCITPNTAFNIFSTLYTLLFLPLVSPNLCRHHHTDLT